MLLLLCALLVLGVFELGMKYPRLLILLGVAVLLIYVLCNVVIFDLAAAEVAYEIMWTFLLSYSIWDGGSCWIAADCKLMLLLLLGVLVLLLNGYEILLGLL